MMQLLLGSNNRNKAGIVRNHLKDLPVELLQPKDIGLVLEPPEDEPTALQNACAKAMAFYRATGLPCVAEDSGLVLLDLPRNHPDQPGIHVRRAAGHEMSDDEMTDWFAAIAHRHGGKLRAAWLDAWALVINETHIFTFEADESYAWAFNLVDTPCETRCPGWPLDCISISPISGLYKTESKGDPRPFYQQRRSGDPAREWLQNTIRATLK